MFYFNKNNTKTNQTVHIVLKDLDGYSGQCEQDVTFNTLTIDFRKEWSLELNYTLNKNAYYELNSITFKYIVDDATFPNTTFLGPKIISLGNMTQFSANKDNSYKCFSKTDIDLNDQVKLEFSNYQAQPFLPKKATTFNTGMKNLTVKFTFFEKYQRTFLKIPLNILRRFRIYVEPESNRNRTEFKQNSK